MKSVRMVDVPSNQRRRLDFDSLMRKSTLAESNIIESGRAEQSTKAIGFGFVDAQVHYGIDTICSNGDVPSNQRRRLDFDSLMRKSTMELMKSVRMVDVPRFELGASTMPR